MILVNLGSVVFAKVLVRHGYWLESKVWKALLMDAQASVPETVLVGSSRTQNHFNTDYFNRRGHSAFNLGAAGILPWEYPSMVEQASRAAGKTVVISLPAEILFLPQGCPRQWTTADLIFYARYAPGCLRELSLAQWLQPLPINGLFSETFTGIQYFPCRKRTGRSLQELLGTAYESGICDDPRGLMMLRYSRRWVAIFNNGDGLILPDSYPDRTAEVIWNVRKGEKFQDEVVGYLKHLADIVRDAGKTPIFVIEAAPIEHQIIDRNLEALTGVRTLYMNEIGFSNEEIADHDHVGSKGNQRLTTWLYEALFCRPDTPACVTGAAVL
ncbi:hypothetical protein HNO91_21070 [Pseudomonas corrugata]|uniref:Uncharacterized protein n=1 Tax=Pseudomonas corrugata TaxID=47879 RepID=A0A7Y5ZAK2_9PSED|nr:hypothetical protein [Pseudomonas corrugata]NUT88926.1 hypothetical protein [Pseudomonas corrugata]